MAKQNSRYFDLLRRLLFTAPVIMFYLPGYFPIHYKNYTGFDSFYSLCG